MLEGDGDCEHDEDASGHAEGLLQTLPRVALLTHLRQHADQGYVDEAAGSERQDPGRAVTCRTEVRSLRGHRWR